MIMKQENKSDFAKKIERGLEVSYQRLIETKRRNKEPLIVMQNNEIIRIMP
jgi:hypothetical protein